MAELVAAARSVLLADAGFATLIGTDIGQDPAGQPYADAWISEGLDDAGMPVHDVNGTGTSALSINVREPWATPNLYNSARFRTLQVLIYSDQTPGQRDASDRCERVSDAVIACLHDPGNARHWWAQFYVVACSLSADLSVMDVPTINGAVRGELRFDVTMG
jgi:hypothetical protein